MLKKMFLGLMPFIVAAMMIFTLVGCGGNQFVGLWTGVAEDTIGSSAPAAVLFSPADWTIMVPEARMYERGSYTASGNKAIVRYNDTIQSAGETFEATITNGSLVSTISGLGTVTLTKSNPIIINQNTWIDGVIDQNTKMAVYSFNAVKGTTYYIWTNDGYQGDGNKTLDIIFSVFDSKEYYNTGDDHWNWSFTFEAENNEQVYILVVPHSSGRQGTFGIAYSTNSTRP